MIKIFKLSISTLTIALFTFAFLSSSSSVNALSINTTNNVQLIDVGDINFEREMRGAWVASVYNLHVPNGLNEQEFRQWADEVTTNLSKLNFNTIIFQVRPMGDALYYSDLVPISHYINGGQQGNPIDYDPLKIIIEKSHANGLEFHAWLNPYRVTTPNVNIEDLCPYNIAVQNPDWLIEVDGQYILNPGIPEVKEHIVEVVMELVNNYDIDAIHFDDYFYPNGITTEDSHTFSVYGGDFSKIEDWRRDNVNILMEKVYNNIKSSKPFVQFGISPLGIWRSSTSHPSGSNTDGAKESYDSIFADSREWIKRGIVDYITPQIYWSTDFEIANFNVLNEWWSNQIKFYSNTRPVNLYIGLADYKVNDNYIDETWLDPMQLPTQVLINRNNSYIQGQMHYAVTHIFQNQLGYMDFLQEKHYSSVSLTPSIHWINPTLPSTPSEVLSTNIYGGVELEINNNDNNVRKYVIYRFKNDEIINFSNEHILGVIYSNNTNTFFDTTVVPGNTYNYAIKSISHTGVISDKAVVITHTS